VSHVVVWRIAADTPEYDAADLTGLGARLSVGRWNRRGTPLVYASSSRALTCLETVVHLGGGAPLPLNRYLVQIQVPDDLWAARVAFEEAGHVGWDALPAGRVSIDWGTRWVHGLESLLADVPSVVVPEERNVLINPLHSDLRRLAARKVRRWTYDGRLA
jgi:RES domain-containing protein